MEPHLSDDQIGGLLQWARDRVPGSTYSDPVCDEAREHLKSCEICQEEVRVQKTGMERLRVLRAEGPEQPSEKCPPEEVWLEIAAGLEIEGSQALVDHACACDYCGPLLRRAAEDLSDGLTTEEEAQIVGLASSSGEWQQSIAVRLSKTGASGESEASHGKRARSRVREWFSPRHLAFAGALAGLAGLMVVGVSHDRLSRFVPGARKQEASNLTQPERTLTQKQPADSEKQRMAASEPGLAARSVVNAPVPQASPVDSAQVAALMLEPGLTRGPGKLKRIALPPGIRFVRVTLPLPEVPGGKLHQDLLTAERQTVWSAVSEPTKVEGESRTLTAMIPAGLLPPNDYLFVVSKESTAGLEVVGSYPFRVTRLAGSRSASAGGEIP